MFPLSFFLPLGLLLAEVAATAYFLANTEG